MAIGGNQVYPSLGDIANLVRSFVNDDKQGITGTAGEGQILVNPTVYEDGEPITNAQGVTLANFMNSAIREIYRECRIMNRPVLIKDNYILYGIPPVNSSLGEGVMNPAVQQSLQFTGFFDGLVFNASFSLPADLLEPLEMWERLTGTTNPFGMMRQSTGALAPRNQVQSLGDWEWRTDGIWLNGATTSRDIRLRYVATYQNLASLNGDWSSIYVPIQDAQEAISDKIAVRYARRLGSAQLADVEAQAEHSVLKLRQQVCLARQMIDYQRPTYGNGAASAAGNPSTFLY